MATPGTLRTQVILAAGLLAAALPARTAWAQAAAHVTPAFGVGFYPYYGHGYSSSLPEGILRGRADVVRALGEAAVLWAEAERKHQDAVRLALENRVRRLQTRQERERMGRTHRIEVQELRRALVASRRAARTGSSALPVKTALADPDTRAANKLDLGRSLLERGREPSARRWLKSVIAEYPESGAAVEASELLVVLGE